MLGRGEGYDKGAYGSKAGKAWGSFDLPFEGRKEEKVVINSLLFIPPFHSLCLSPFFLIGAKELKSHIPLSHGIRYVGRGGQANDSTCTHTHTHTLDT